MTNQESPQTPVPPVDEKKAAEIEKNYVEAISRATKFLISSAIILLILILVVGQELREYRKKQNAFVKEIVTTAKSERIAVGNVYKKYACIRCELKKKTNEITDKKIDRCELNEKTDPRSISVRADVQLWEIPRRTSSVHDSKDIDALVRDEQKLGELVKNVKQKLADEIAKNEANKKEKQAPRNSGIGRSPNTAQPSEGESIAPRPAESNAANSPEDFQYFQAENSFCKLPDDAEAHPLSGLIAHLTQYRGLYDDRIGLARELLSTTKESEELKSAKKSIPTPFGSFEIAPKLALLGLAFAVLLTYVSFCFSIRKIRRLANDYRDLTPGTTSPAFRIPAPFWSPDPEPEAQKPSDYAETLGWDVVLSVLLHVVWLSVAVWLIVECVATWQATKALAFDYKTFWKYLLIASLVATALFAVWQYLPSRLKRNLPVKDSEQAPAAGLSRRYFVSLAALGLLGVVTIGVIRFLSKPIHILSQRRKLADFTPTPVKGKWIENKRNNIIHYGPICNSHLPPSKNRLKEITDKKGVHAGCETQIFAALGTLALNQVLLRQRDRRDLTKAHSEEQMNEDESFGEEPAVGEMEQGKLAISCFKKAIDLSPLSWHLYDTLCKVYSTVEFYVEIVPMYQTGLSKVQNEIELTKNAHTTSGKKRLKFLRRAEGEFISRIERTNRRDKRFEEYRQEKGRKAKEAEDKANAKPNQA